MGRLLASTYDRIIVFLLVVQYVFINLIFTTNTQNIVILKDLGAPLLSLLILSLWFCGDLAKYGKWKLPRHFIVPAMVFALIYWIVPVYRAPFTGAAVEEYGMTLVYFIITFAVLRFMNSYQRLELFMFWFILTNFLTTLYGLTQLLERDLLVELGWIQGWGRSDIFVSTHGNPNFFSGYMICTLPVIMGYWLVTRNVFMITALPFVIGLNIYCLINAEARGAYLGIGFAVVVFVAGLAINFRNLHVLEEKWRKTTFQATAIAIVVALAFGLVVKGDKVVETGRLIYKNYETVLRGLEGHWTNRVRLVFWQMAVDGGRKSVIFGRGIGNYNFSMPEMRPPNYHRLGCSHNTDHPHDEYLEWFFDSGLIGFAAFIAILLCFARANIEDLRFRRKDYLYPFVLGAALGPWAQWIQAAFDVETRWTGNNVTLWFGVGMVLAVRNLALVSRHDELSVEEAIQPKDSRRRRGALRVEPDFVGSPYITLVAVSCALFIAFYVNVAYRHWKSDFLQQRVTGFTDYNYGSASGAMNDAVESIELSPYNVSAYYKLAFVFIKANQIPESLAAYRALQRLAPNYAQIHINIGQIADQLGMRHTAAWERVRAATIEYNGRNMRDAAGYWMQLGYPVRAIGYLRHAVSMERDREQAAQWHQWWLHDDIRIELARVYGTLGNVEQMRREVREALIQNPSNTNAIMIWIELLRRAGQNEEVARVMAGIRSAASNDPQIVLLDAGLAVEAGEYDRAIELIESVAFRFPLAPQGASVSDQTQFIAQSALEQLQRISTSGSNIGRCYHAAGWLYAAVGDLQRAESFLNMAYGKLDQNPAVAERLGQVRAARRQ